MNIVSVYRCLYGCLLWIYMFASVRSQTVKPACFLMTCGSFSNSFIKCQDSRILIVNATTREGFQESIFRNVGRVCNGISQCSMTNQCISTRNVAMKVTYMCIDDTNTEKQCRVYRQGITESQGFVQSPGYPAPSKYNSPCRWRMVIPDQKYAIVRVHDLQTNIQGTCKGALEIHTTACEDGESLSFSECRGITHPPIYACSIVDIVFSVARGDRGARFWLSYEVLTRGGSLNDKGLWSLVQPCGLGISHEYSPIFGPIPSLTSSSPSSVTTISSLSTSLGHFPDLGNGSEVAPGYEDGTGESSSDEGNSELIIVIVIAVIVLLIVNISVAVFCLWRRGFIPCRRKSRRQGTPPLATTGGNNQNTHPMLREGYSKVSDEIPQSDITGPYCYADICDAPDVVPKLPTGPPRAVQIEHGINNNSNNRNSPMLPRRNMNHGEDDVLVNNNNNFTKNSATMPRKTPFVTGVTDVRDEKSHIPPPRPNSMGDFLDRSNSDISENIYEEIEETDDSGRNKFKKRPATGRGRGARPSCPPPERPKSVAALKSRFEVKTPAEGEPLVRSPTKPNPPIPKVVPETNSKTSNIPLRSTNDRLL